MNKKVLFIAHAAVIAALYVVLTFVANAFGLANYAVQVRFSEALTILPFFPPAAIPGLTIGCLLSNILACREDVASVIRYLCRKRYPVDVVRIVCGLRIQVALSNEKSVKVIHKNT